MAIPVQSFDWLTQPVIPHPQPSFFGPIAEVLQEKQRRQAAKDEAAATHRDRQQDFALRQGGLAHQMQQDVAAAERAKLVDARDTARLDFDKQRYGDAQRHQDEEERDQQFGHLYGAIGAHNPELINAYLQDLERHGYQVERDDTPPGMELRSGDAPSMAAPQQAPAAPQKPAVQRQMHALDGMGSSAVGALQRGGKGYSPLPDNGSMERPAPARSSLLEQPWGRRSLTPSLADATGVVRQPWSNSGPSGIRPPQARPAPAAAEGGPLPPARMEGDQQPALPPAQVAPQRHGVRVKDASGNVVFNFDPATGSTSRRDALLRAIGVTSQGARDGNESRAADMAVATTESLLHAGVPEAKAYEDGRHAYEFELSRLGKMRQSGGHGTAPTGPTKADSAFGKEIDDFAEKQGARENIKKLNEKLLSLNESARALGTHGGHAQYMALLASLRAAVGRVTNTEIQQTKNSFGKLAHAEHVLSQWTGEGEMPPQMVAAMNTALGATNDIVMQRKRDIAARTGELAARHPGWKLTPEQQAEAKRHVNDSLLGADSAPEAAPQAPAAAPGAPAAPTVVPVPAKAGRNPKEAAQFLIDKMGP